LRFEVSSFKFQVSSFKFEVVESQTSNLKLETILVPPLGVRGLF